MSLRAAFPRLPWCSPFRDAPRSLRIFCLNCFEKRFSTDGFQALNENALERPPFTTRLEMVRPGRNLSVLSTQNESDRVVFFVHGAGGRKGQWRNQIPHFVNLGYNICAYDFIGHGRSDKPEIWEDFNPKEIVADLIAVFNKYKGKQNMIVAHSIGTGVTLHSLLELKKKGQIDSISHVVLIATQETLAISPWTRNLLSLIPSTFYELARPLLGFSFRSTAWNPRSDQKLTDFERLQTNHNSMFVMQALICQFYWPIKEEIQQLNDTNVKFLLISGEKDRLTPSKSARILQGWLQNAHPLVELKNSGHLPMLENPQTVNNLIEEFLQK